MNTTLARRAGAALALASLLAIAGFTVLGTVFEYPQILEEPTADILAEVVTRRREGTLVIGFAAETEEMLANGRAKLERKGVDAVVVNDVAASDLGFDSSRNAGIFLKRDGAVEIPAMTKAEMAERILDEIGRLRVESPRIGNPA